MKEIKLNNVDYLRSGSCKTFVDENEVQFIDGIALVKAKSSGKNWRSGEPFSYESFGLINEDFEEVYDDSLDGRTSRYLMFLGHNNCALRFGKFDYLVSVATADDGRSWHEHYHIRIIDGVPTVIKNLDKIVPTEDSKIITDGHALYDVENAIFLTRRYSSIEQQQLDESGIPTYLVSDVVTSYEYQNDDPKKIKYPINKDTGIVDKLSFVIDGTDRIISPIYSDVEHNWYISSCDDEINYGLVKEQRIAELKNLEQRSIELSQGLQLKRFLKLPKDTN